MWPFVFPGTKFVVKRCLPRELVLGDLLVYEEASGRMVCHRVIKLPNRAGTGIYLVRQDNCHIGNRGERVDPERMIGKVIGMARGGRLLNLACWQSKLVAYLLIYTAPFFCAIIRLLQRILPKANLLRYAVIPYR